MLLALIMATLTLGLLFSGWLTPTPGRAQQVPPNPQPNVESCTNCISEGSVVFEGETYVPVVCIGNSVTVDSGSFLIYSADVRVITTNSDGSTTTTDYAVQPNYSMTWTASVGSFNASGTGDSATFTPTNGGCGTVIFTCNYTNLTPCGDIGHPTTTSGFSVAQMSTNCTSGTVVLGNSSSATNLWYAANMSVTLSATNNNISNSIVVTTHDPCGINPDTYVTNLVAATIITNWWTVNYGSFSTNGSGLSATFTLTNPGSGTVTFNEEYTQNTPCDTNVYSATPLSIPFNVISVTLTNMGFANGNHQISKDDGSGTYPSPEWQLLTNNMTTNYPTCYTRNTSMTVTPNWIIIPGGFSGPVLVKGISSGPQLPVVSGFPGSVTSTDNFKNKVDFLNPLTIDWQASLDGGTNWHDIATTANQVYVTLNDPTCATLYHTVVWLACVNAVGQTTVGGTADAVFSGFTGLVVKRVSDNIQMTYWMTNSMGDYQMGATETGGILSAADANGNCQAWSALLRDCFRAHGISADRIKALPVAASDQSILVKDWQFNNPPSGSGTYPYNVGTDAFDLPGVPGQGNSNPPGGFNGHWITLCNGSYYDPSYGTSKVSGANKDKDYEDGSLAGYGESLPPSNGTGVRKNDTSAGSASELHYTTDN